MSLSSNPESANAALTEQKRFARSLFTAVMAGVDVPRRMRECFSMEGDRLRVGDELIQLDGFSHVLMAAIGKAAVPMAEHAIETLRPHIALSGVVVGVGAWDCPDAIRYFKGGHPLPDENSLEAAQALLELMRLGGRETLVLFLISGGASAMAEAPLDSSIPYRDLVAFYQHLLHSGLPITKTNALRKHLSAIKGGRLALASGEATRCTLLISDVPPGMLDVVGSGPSIPDSSTIADCRKLLLGTPLFAQVSPALQMFFHSMPETPKILPRGRLPSTCFSALSSDSLVQAAEDIASRAGYRTVIDNDCDDWDYRDAAMHLFSRAQREIEAGLPLCILSAGEVTVSIAGQVGQGGRNQQWALEMARLISGQPGFVALSAGSDGIDGNSPAAGAVVDSTTWTRATEMGFDPEVALQSFNTYPLFAHLGDAVVPGPSGNNLRDLRVVLVHGTS